MSKHVFGLACLLAVQILIIAFLWMRSDSVDEARATFVSFVASEVNVIELKDGDKTIVLSSSQGEWQVDDQPADELAVASFLTKLGELDAQWPVASTASSRRRFEVDENNFQRFVRLLSDEDVLAEFYLGTSPGYEKVHARAVGSNNIFSLALSNYEVAVNRDHWLDKLLFATTKTPVGVHIDYADDEQTDASLVHGDEGWLFNGGPADQAAASNYANRFSNLRILGLSDSQAKTDQVARFTLTIKDKQVQFLLLSQADTEDYLLQRDDDNSLYRLASYTAEQILMTDTHFKPEDYSTVGEDTSLAKEVEGGSK